jgi:[ribosomal protein S5]-alanine N-acetyltransferase
LNAVGRKLEYLPIKTERLLLRDFAVGDWPSVHSYAADPDVVRYVEWGPNTESDSRNFVDYAIRLSKEDPRLGYELAVVLPIEKTLVGVGAIHISNPVNREGWIGYCFNKRYWGEGMATETAAALLAFGFSQLGLNRIFATVDPKNRPSANVLLKIGMLYEGHLREHKLVRGRWRNTDLYAIIRSDLPGLQALQL